MSVKNSVERLKSKLLSVGCLPGEFATITAKGIPLNVKASPLKHHGFDRSADADMIPFIEIADGALVAFWISVSPAAIVAIDAHGEPPRIVAKDFQNFLRALSNSKTGVEDIDLDFLNITIPGYSELPSRSGVAALQKRLDKWAVANRSNQEPDRSSNAEAIRKQCHVIAKRMIRDGCSKVYNSRSMYWSMDYKVLRSKAGFQVTYLDYGKWFSVPEEYELVSVIEKLVERLKDPKLKKFDLCITKHGIVSVNDDSQLVLVPPGMKFD